MAKFKVGDKVKVVRDEGSDFAYGFNSEMRSTIQNGGVVQEVYSDSWRSATGYIVDGYHYAEGELALAKAKKVKPATNAPRLYAVVDQAGVLYDTSERRKDARKIKKALGGKKLGIEIQVYEPVMEVR